MPDDYDQKLDLLIEAVERLQRKINAIEAFRRAEQPRGDSRSDFDIICPERPRYHSCLVH